MQHIENYLNNHTALQDGIEETEGTAFTNQPPVLATPVTIHVAVRTAAATVAGYTVARNYVG